jgi:hypothetical protein
MPVSPLSIFDAKALDEYVDLGSVPRHRFFGRNEFVDRFRLAVPFDHIAIGGLDIDHYGFGAGFSIDTDFPPQFLESYEADKLDAVDPFVLASKKSRSIVVGNKVYSLQEPPQRLLYLQRLFGIHNRTLVPILREGGIWRRLLHAIHCFCGRRDTVSRTRVRTYPHNRDEASHGPVCG